MIRCLTSIAALSLLAACGDDAPQPESDDARTASGEVLEGTISDAMLPVETLKSQPPLARPSPDATSAGAAVEDEGETAEEGVEVPADDQTAPPVTEPAGEPAE
ncbi:MAG TPA: hypothetical protein VGA34_09850 [Alteraurantiacibacter sp.]|jgi:hypothetical protein